MDYVNPEVAHLFLAKAQRRRALAALPFAEKVRAVVQLQLMAAPILVKWQSGSALEDRF